VHGDKKIIVYNHIGATGGATLWGMLLNRYDSMFCKLGALEFNAKCFRLAIQKKFENSDTVIVPQLGFDNNYLELLHCDNVINFTMLREPVKHLLSLYFWHYCNMHGIGSYLLRKTKMPTFKEYCQETSNVQIRSILNKWGEPITLADYEEAKSKLEDYLVVGLTEQYDETLYLLYRKLGWPKLPYYYYAAEVKSTVPEELARQSAEDMNYINELSKYDIKLYNYFKQKLEESIQNFSLAETAEMESYIDNQEKVSEGSITIEQLDLLKIVENTKSIYIFGSGQGGKKVYNFLKNHQDCCRAIVKGFIDYNEEKQGAFIDGVKIISLTECSFKDDDYIIVSTLDCYKEMNKVLLARGIIEEHIIFPESLLKEELDLVPKGIIKNDKRREASFHATVEEMIPVLINIYQVELISKIEKLHLIDNIKLYFYVCGEQQQFFLEALARVSEKYPIHTVYYYWQKKINQYTEWALLLNKLKNNSQGGIYIAGTGRGGQILFDIIQNSPAIHELGFKVQGFFDNDPIKQNTMFNGMPVMASSNTHLSDNDYCIIASLSHYEEIKKHMLGLGIREEKIITLNLLLSEKLEEMHSEAKEIQIWNLKIENYEQLVAKKYAQDLTELIKPICEVSTIKKVHIDVRELDSETRAFLIEAKEKIAEKYPKVDILLYSNENQTDEADIHVVGSVMMDTNKIIDELLDSGVNVRKILQLW